MSYLIYIPLGVLTIALYSLIGNLIARLGMKGASLLVNGNRNFYTFICFPKITAFSDDKEIVKDICCADTGEFLYLKYGGSLANIPCYTNYWETDYTLRDDSKIEASKITNKTIMTFLWPFAVFNSLFEMWIVLMAYILKSISFLFMFTYSATDKAANFICHLPRILFHLPSYIRCSFPRKIKASIENNGHPYRKQLQK